MSTTITRVAVAGATGNLGPAIIHALTSASPSFDITILSRTGRLPQSIPQATHLNVTKVDYSSHDSLVSALRHHDVVLSLIPNHGDQPALIDAAIAAGVPRFIPSEFGVDVAGNAKVAALPVFKSGKIVTQKHLREKAAQGKISYVIISTGAFLDWGIETGFVLTLAGSNEGVREGKCKIYDGGRYDRSMTTLADIGKSVVGVLRKWDEVKDKSVFVQSVGISQMELLEIARSKGAKVEVEEVDLDKQEKDCYAVVERMGKEEKVSDDEIGQAMFGFVGVGCWKKGYGTNWGERHDSELLGVTEISREDLEELVGRYV